MKNFQNNRSEEKEINCFFIDLEAQFLMVPKKLAFQVIVSKFLDFYDKTVKILRPYQITNPANYSSDEYDQFTKDMDIVHSKEEKEKKVKYFKYLQQFYSLIEKQHPINSQMSVIIDEMDSCSRD